MAKKRYLDEIFPEYVANYDDTYGAKYGVLPEVVVTPKGVPNVIKPKLNEKQWQNYWGNEGAASVSRGMNQAAPVVGTILSAPVMGLHSGITAPLSTLGSTLGSIVGTEGFDYLGSLGNNYKSKTQRDILRFAGGLVGGLGGGMFGYIADLQKNLIAQKLLTSSERKPLLDFKYSNRSLRQQNPISNTTSANSVPVLEVDALTEDLLPTDESRLTTNIGQHRVIRTPAYSRVEPTESFEPLTSIERVNDIQSPEPIIFDELPIDESRPITRPRPTRATQEHYDLANKFMEDYIDGKYNNPHVYDEKYAQLRQSIPEEVDYILADNLRRIRSQIYDYDKKISTPVNTARIGDRFYAYKGSNSISGDYDENGILNITDASFFNPGQDPDALLREVGTILKKGDVISIASHNGSLSHRSYPQLVYHLARAIQDPNNKGFNIEPTKPVRLNGFGNIVKRKGIMYQPFEAYGSDKSKYSLHTVKAIQALNDAVKKRYGIDLDLKYISNEGKGMYVPGFIATKLKYGGIIK